MSTIEQILKNKQGDLALQVTAAVLPLLAVFAAGAPALIFAYFSVGGVQFFSCIANRVSLPKAARARSRTAYELMLLTICVTFLVFAALGFPEGNLAMCCGLLLVGPLMAIWYGSITNREIALLKEVVRRKKLDEIAAEVDGTATSTMTPAQIKPNTYGTQPHKPGTGTDL